MDIFEPNDSESCIKHCGEIFLTTKGNLTIHCTLCEVIYKNYEAYTAHLYEKHLNNLEDNLSPDKKIDCSAVSDSINSDSRDIVSLVKVEMESPENDFLKEEELPIDSLVEVPNDEEHDYLTETESSNSSKDMQSPQLDIPIFSRKPKNGTKCKKMTTTEKRKKDCNKKKPECLQCRKGYNATTEDRINNRYHTCERKFLCSYCGRSFARNSHLKRHIKSHTNQRDYKCEICDKAFYQNDTLKRHMMGHSSERPFACNTCSATFSRKSALRNHAKLHENKREYKCKLCERGFNQQAGLVSHMKVVHKIT